MAFDRDASLEETRSDLDSDQGWRLATWLPYPSAAATATTAADEPTTASRVASLVVPSPSTLEDDNIRLMLSAHLSVNGKTGL